MQATSVIQNNFKLFQMSSSFLVFDLASLASSRRQSSDLTQFASGSPIRIIGKGKSCSMRT